MMFSKIFLILAIAGVYLVSSLDITDLFLIEIPTVESTQKKIEDLRGKAYKLYDSVKDNWHLITNEVTDSAHAVSETYHKAKNQTLKLIDDGEAIYKKIKVFAVKNYDNFNQVHKDLTEMVKNLEEHGGQAYDDFMNLLDELTQDVSDFKDFFQTGDLTNLKKDLYQVKEKYNAFHEHFDQLIGTAIENYKRTEHDTKVLIDGIERDAEDVIKDSRRLFDEAHELFNNIIFEGKREYLRFKKVYDSLKQTMYLLEDLILPVKYEKLENAMKVINNFIEKHETLAKIAEEAVTIEEELAAEEGLVEALELLVLL